MRSHAARARFWGLVLTMGLALGVLAPTAAFAQSEEPSYPTTPTTPTTDVAGTTVTVGDPRVASRASSLPFTGGDVALLTVLGVVALGSGIAVVAFTRRHSTSHG